MSGHGSAIPDHVCACDLHPALDADYRAALGPLYRPAVALAQAMVRVLGWLT